MKFHHIGYLKLDLKNSLNEFKYLNYSKKGKFINDSKLRVKIQFIKNNSNLIELVKPHKGNYGLFNLIKKKNYAYHFAYKVKSIKKTINSLKRKKFILVINPTPAKAFNNKKVAFLKMKNSFLIELIES